MTAIRLTPIREKILTIIKKHKGFITVKDILKAGKKLDKVTVYRALEAFIMAGMVREFQLSTGEKGYEMGDAFHHHHHFRCEKCREIFHLPCEFDHVVEQWEQKTGFEFHSFDFSGICKNCGQK